MEKKKIPDLMILGETSGGMMGSIQMVIGKTVISLSFCSVSDIVYSLHYIAHNMGHFTFYITTVTKVMIRFVQRILDL